MGIDSKELLKEAAKHIKDEVTSKLSMVWPQEVSELASIIQKAEKTPDVLQSFLCYLIDRKDAEKHQPKILFLSDAIS